MGVTEINTYLHCIYSHTCKDTVIFPLCLLSPRGTGVSIAGPWGHTGEKGAAPPVSTRGARGRKQQDRRFPGSKRRQRC